jgi:hypothetical protein
VAIEASVRADRQVVAARVREARPMVVARYGWDRVVDQLEALYGVRREHAA